MSWYNEYMEDGTAVQNSLLFENPGINKRSGIIELV